jgi:hypothetical protein
MRAKIVAFRSWLLAEAAADAHDLAALPRRQPQAASDQPK